MYIWALILLLLTLVYPVKIHENLTSKQFVNIPETIGNHLAAYFHDYIVSICKKEDYLAEKSDSLFLKELPTHIPFRKELFLQLEAKNITLEKMQSIKNITLWECTQDFIMDAFQVLKPTIHGILDKALIKAGLKRVPLSTVIHFRCADTPFIKHISYFLQRYSFFKESLEKINPSDKSITLMNCSTHLSKKEEQDSCSSYVKHLSEYIESIGYDVNVQCHTNVEDFADLFYAKAVISTGGSFSFMSGFFGHGQFISTEHKVEGNTCNTNECNEIFIRGHNIMHTEVDSYYDVDKVYTLLTN